MPGTGLKEHTKEESLDFFDGLYWSSSTLRKQVDVSKCEQLDGKEGIYQAMYKKSLI